ncbi:hypothetical protein V1522DRAFT_389273 [Lipomyces starkeyi]
MRIGRYLRTRGRFIDRDTPLVSMDTKELQADNIAKGVIVGHVNNLTMLTVNMFDRAFDMFAFLRTRYTEANADRQAELLAKLYSTKMLNTESLRSHLETMLLLRKQLQLGHTELSDAIFLQALYKSLAPKFLDYKNSLRARHLITRGYFVADVIRRRTSQG